MGPKKHSYTVEHSISDFNPFLKYNVRKIDWSGTLGDSVKIKTKAEREYLKSTQEIKGATILKCEKIQVQLASVVEGVNNGRVANCSWT